MSKPRISFIVQYPSSDLDGKHIGATIYARGTCHTLDEIADLLNFGIPSHILQMVRRAFETEYRVELLIAGTEYKFYKQPGDLPKQEEGTKLEQWQDTYGYKDGDVVVLPGGEVRKAVNPDCWKNCEAVTHAGQPCSLCPSALKEGLKALGTKFKRP